MSKERRDVPNESMRLFEIGVDEEFRRNKGVVFDSSLGILPTPPRRPKRSKVRKC